MSNANESWRARTAIDEAQPTADTHSEDVVIDLRERPLATFDDEISGVRIELHHPLDSPHRWRSYLDGAEAQYRAWGILSALDRPALESGRSTALFFLAVDRSGQVVGGIRCHGPLRSASEAYALVELRDNPRLGTIRDLLIESVALGVVEVKGAWVDRERAPAGVSDALARCLVHAMNWFGARHAICTCSDVVAARWTSAGGRAFPDFGTVAYPDDRYRTVPLWWDSERVASLARPDQWAAIVRESRGLVHRSALDAPPPAHPVRLHRLEWRAEVLDERVASDAVRLLELRSDPAVEVLDRFDEQLAAFRAILPPAAVELEAEAPRWVHYPWRGTVARLLGPDAFRRLRLDRNRNKITREEQTHLGKLCIGVVGLSVGHAIAHVLAMEGICGNLRLADFDRLELSNLNRVPATVLDLGLNKAIVVARRIAELDPYLAVEVVQGGLDADNLDRFVDGLDVVVEECDSLDMKALVRESARRARVPVLMETSDRGLLDVERFDLEPDRPLFHGLLGDIEAAELVGLSTHDKVPHVLRILEPDQLSSRMAASMAEIDETLATWPQLGGDVMLGGATIAAAVRAIALGEALPSGRGRIDLAAVVANVREPEPPRAAVAGAVQVLAVPVDPRLAIAHAAHLAPSGGNVQPWMLQIDEHRLRIFIDRSATTGMDVRFRGSYVAIGAALLNARAAAAAEGLLGPVTVFPSGPDSDVVAELEFSQRRDRELGAMYPHVLERTTNRKAGEPAAIPAEVVAVLNREVEQEGARLHLVTDGDAIIEYSELLGESDRLRYLTPQLHAEMMAELRWPETDSVETGIDVRTLELDHSDLAKLAVARRADVMADLAGWNGGRALGEVSRDRVRTSSAVAAVTVSDSEPGSYVMGGAALERLWLASQAAGLAVQPVSPVCVFAVDDDDFAGLVPPPYVARLRTLAQRLRQVLGVDDGEHLALVVRLSHAAPPTMRSERKPLSEVICP